MTERTVQEETADVGLGRNLLLFYFMHTHVLSACILVHHHLCARCPWRPEDGIGSPQLDVHMVVVHVVSPSGCWVLIPGPLQEQQMLLSTEPSLQPHR